MPFISISKFEFVNQPYLHPNPLLLKVNPKLQVHKNFYIIVYLGLLFLINTYKYS